MLLNQLSKTIIDFIPDYGCGHGAQFALRNFDSKIHLAAMSDIDNGCGGATCVRSGEEFCNQFDWLLSSRESDADWPSICKRFQAFKRDREMSSALIIGDGMDLVHNYGFNVA